MVSALTFLSGCEALLPEGDEVVMIVTGTKSMYAGSPAFLNAEVIHPLRFLERASWSFSDGQDDIPVEFGAPGIYGYVVRSITSIVTVGSTSGVLIVSDEAAAPRPPFPGFPAVWGDTGANGTLGLDDLLLAAQASRGLYTLGNEGVSAADLNLNGKLDETDLALVASALLQEQALPTAMLQTDIRPYQNVTIVSPLLLDPHASVRVSVGDYSVEPMRALHGYASFIVPDDTFGPSSRTVAVKVKVLDVFGTQVAEAETTATVLPIAVSTTDPKADVTAFLNEYIAALNAHAAAVETYIATHGGLSPEQVGILKGFALGAARDMQALATRVAALMDNPGGDDLARYVQFVLLSNGLETFRTSAGPGAFAALAPVALTPSDVCDVLVPGICGLKQTAAKVHKATQMLSATCELTSLQVVVNAFPITEDSAFWNNVVMKRLLAECSAVAPRLEFATLVLDLVEELTGIGIVMTSDKSEMASGETATISTHVRAHGLANLCDRASAPDFEGFLTRYIEEKVHRRVLSRADYLFLAETYQRFGGGFYAGLAAANQPPVSEPQLRDAVVALSQQACAHIQTNGTGASGLLADARDFALTVSQPGAISYNTDGTASVMCPDPASQTGPFQTVSAEKQLCSGATLGSFTANLDITCGAGRVTITMGDNGATTDDIFEVVYAGKTILTTSSPTASTSVTVAMPRGQNTVELRGRAASDGVGDYFISFDGAATLSGETTGTDLTPGVTKTFVIEVQ